MLPQTKASGFLLQQGPCYTLMICHLRIFHGVLATLIKNKIKFSSYIGKFRVEQLQSHI
jgi:hypothetical protein